MTESKNYVCGSIHLGITPYRSSLDSGCYKSYEQMSQCHVAEDLETDLDVVGLGGLRPVMFLVQCHYIYSSP